MLARVDTHIVDGKLTMSEWMDHFCIAAVNPAAPQTRAHLAQQTSWRLLVKSLKIFDRVDADHSGKLEYAEFAEFGALIGLDERETELLWHAMDDDESGSINIVELFRQPDGEGGHGTKTYAQREQMVKADTAGGHAVAGSLDDLCHLRTHPRTS